MLQSAWTDDVGFAKYLLWAQTCSMKICVAENYCYAVIKLQKDY